MRKRTKTPNYSIFASSKRLKFVAFCVFAVFAVVSAKLVYLQVFQHQESLDKANKMRNKMDILYAKRGDICDSNGNILASSRPIIELGVDPSILDYSDLKTLSKLSQIAKILNIPEDDFKYMCRQGTYVSSEDSSKTLPVRWRKLLDKIDSQTYEKIKEVELRAIYGIEKYDRFYPSTEVLSHALGFVNKEFKASSGVELMCDYYLRGQNGWIESERDGKRKEAVQFRKREFMPKDGENVELSIDIVIQSMVHSAVKEITQKFNPKKVSIIVSEPATGYILAMDNYPYYDPNKYNTCTKAQLRNSAISDQYEPGSTFKIVAISGALNEHLVGPDDVFDCSKTHVLYKNKEIRMPKDTKDYGKLNVREITKKSSNKGSVYLGVKLGETKFLEYCKEFGFGKKTNIGLTGEATGTLISPEHKLWNGIIMTRMPMGHSVAATPLQVHFAMATIANQGIYLKPQLVKRIYDNNNNTKIFYDPKAERRVITPKIASLMTDLLCEVVKTGGTATRAAIDGYEIAAKTGTTQKIIDGKYSSKHHIASLSAFFPAYRPRIAITIVVDEPNLDGIGYGGLVVGPVFKSLAQGIIDYLGIKSDEDFDKSVAWKGIL